jgi:hypothetical protein
MSGRYTDIVGELSRREATEVRLPQGLSVEIASVSTAEEPLAVSEAESFLRLDNTPDTGLLATIISGVRRGAEKYTGRLFVRREVTLTWREFYGRSRLLYPPLDESSVTVEVKEDGAFSAVSDVEVDGKEVSVGANTVDSPARITYQAGFETLPPNLRLQMLHDIRATYDHRDPMTGDTASDGGMISRKAYDQWRVRQ